jgi:hypothetical protein
MICDIITEQIVIKQKVKNLMVVIMLKYFIERMQN